MIRITESKDYAGDLAAVGLVVGGFVGYVLRPFAELSFGKGPLSSFEIFPAALGNGGDYLQAMAIVSIQYVIAGALVGMALGWILGKHTRQT